MTMIYRRQSPSFQLWAGQTGLIEQEAVEDLMSSCMLLPYWSLRESVRLVFLRLVLVFGASSLCVVVELLDRVLGSS